jgi:TetR/AcrR family transcriptional regulator, lmrAB and yxaGH operons repressor
MVIAILSFLSGERHTKMMPRRSDARRNALIAAERLFRIKGYAATGLAEILAASGAPKGSFYFHFPDGKAQVAREVLAAYDARGAAVLTALARRHAGEPDAFVAALCDAIIREMRDADWMLGCAAQNIAAEALPADDALLASAAAVFASWVAILARALGRPRRESHRTALALLAAIAGARTLARASRSAAPFEAIKRMRWGPSQ